MQCFCLLFAYKLSIAGDLENAFELLKSMDRPVHFYGKVVDQNNQPVSGASVFVHVRGSLGVKEITVKTDGLGVFSVTNESGHLILIDSIALAGYEFKISQNLLNNDFEINDNYHPDPAKPVIYIVRKKEPPATVIPGRLSLVLNEQHSAYEVDLIKKSRGDPGQFGKDPFQIAKHADFIIKGKASEDRKSFTITVEATDQASGVQLKDELLYMAPENGYLEKDSVAILPPGNVNKYLYVKGRNGKLFSRVDLEIRMQSNDSASVSLHSWTNPTGSRNVDFDDDKYGEWLKQKH